MDSINFVPRLEMAHITDYWRDLENHERARQRLARLMEIVKEVKAKPIKARKVRRQRNG